MLVAVSTTPSSNHHEFLVRAKTLFLPHLIYLSCFGHCSRYVSSEDHFLTDVFRYIVFTNWVIKVLISVYPDFRVITIQHLIDALFLPILLCAGSIVHDIPEAKHRPRTFMATINPLQSRDNLPLEPQRCFIHNKQSWLKGLSGTGNYSLTNLKGMACVNFYR